MNVVRVLDMPHYVAAVYTTKNGESAHSAKIGTICFYRLLFLTYMPINSATRPIRVLG